MTKIQQWAITTVLPIMVLFGLTYWYQWGSRALLPFEVNEYMASIEAQTKTSSARHDLIALRKFLDNDDGKPFYTVNLYNFYDLAHYPENSGFSGTGKQAYDRFSNTMLKLMAQRGSHPVFGSQWGDPASSDWDRVVIVRYRSRRDLVNLYSTDDFAQASLHKWASIREHNRMLVHATHLPDGKYILFLIALFIGLATNAICRVTVHKNAT